jgi:hypothetical protein
VKVRGEDLKIFVVLGAGEEHASLIVKLLKSNLLAFGSDWAEPTGYGLGKSGWVSARVRPELEVPVALFFDWIEESYRALAPGQLHSRAFR